MTASKTGVKNVTPKKTPTQLRKECEDLTEKLNNVKEGGYCYMCDLHKAKSHFYKSTNPIIKSGITPICKRCAYNIACRMDKNGEFHEPTKESIQMALRYLDKPFLETVYDASIQESSNLAIGKIKYNVWTSYIKNIAMPQYYTLTYANSDMFKKHIVYDDELKPKRLQEEDSDLYNQFIKNKADVVKLLGYEPFEKEKITDQPLLYSQLLGFLDSSEDANDDMMRVSSSISIVRGFLQHAQIDDLIAKLIQDQTNAERNVATIKSLQDMKQKVTSTISNLAEQSCISLKHSKNAKKGENTWTGKIKKLKDMNLREAEVNGFDIATCRGMQQVMDLSNASILKQLHLDESEYSDMLAEQRSMLTDLQSKVQNYEEISRILLRENLDLKDFLNEQHIDISSDLVDLNELFSCFSTIDIEEGEEVVTK